MTVALTGIILLLDRMLMGFFMPFLALPLVVYGSYYSLNESIIVAVSNVIIAMILVGLLPTVLTSIGYSTVGLAYIYAYHNNFTKKQTYVIMSVFMAIFYVIMVLFFGEYFGLNITETIDSISGFVQFLPAVGVKIAAYVLSFLTMLMEVFIVKVSGDMVVTLLQHHRKK